MTASKLDLSGIAKTTAIYNAREHRDFRLLLSILKDGGEIDADVRQLLIEEVTKLSQLPMRPRKKPTLHPTQVKLELDKVRAILAGDARLAEDEEDLVYEAYEEFAGRLGEAGDFTRKGDVTKAAKAILCHILDIKPAKLERLLYPAPARKSETSAKPQRRE